MTVSHRSIALNPPACTSCMLCEKECPDQCITIESHPEVLPAGAERTRDVTVQRLDRFALDYGLCLFCSICIDVCPFDALAWVPVPPVPARSEGAPGSGRNALVYEIAQLAEHWDLRDT